MMLAASSPNGTATSGARSSLWIASTSGPGPLSNCLAGESVDIELPIGASIDLEARTAGAVIDSVKKANVKIVEGSISLRNIAGGIQANAYQGDVMVESFSRAGWNSACRAA